eukprot:scaffold269085_cov30-Tisochrysis_lutea.AAC.1
MRTSSNHAASIQHMTHENIKQSRGLNPQSVTLIRYYQLSDAPSRARGTSSLEATSSAAPLLIDPRVHREYKLNTCHVRRRQKWINMAPSRDK